MTLDELKKTLKTDAVARAKFHAHTIKYYHDIGLDITADDLKVLSEEALRNSAEGRGTAGTTNVAVTIGRAD